MPADNEILVVYIGREASQKAISRLGVNASHRKVATSLLIVSGKTSE